MTVQRDGRYLADRVRTLCEERRSGKPWKAEQILRILDRAERSSEDHKLFYLTFLEGIRDMLDDEDEDPVLVRFARQAIESEGRVIADSKNRDHLTHVTQVFLVGWLVLNECERFRTLGDEWAPYGWTTDRFERLNRGWVLTSLLHDCAYPVETAKDTREHEIRLRATFGKVYEPAVGGRVSKLACAERGLPLWKHRARLIDRPITSEVRRVLEVIEALPDHGFITGQALMAEADRHDAGTADILRTAAVSLLCHNFRHNLHPKRKPSAEVMEWFGLDFWQEPLAGILTVADEIQEWGRERTDAAYRRSTAQRVVPFEDTSLTHLSVGDISGLTIDAAIHYKVPPAARRDRERIARDREVENADTARTYRNGFKPREREHRAFALHFRIQETVEDIPCRVFRSYDWPEDVLRKALQGDFTAREDAILEAQSVVINDGDARLIELRRDGTLTRLEWPEDVRSVAVVAPGGAGKSTLLRELARSESQGSRAVRYVAELSDDLYDLAAACRQVHDTAGRDVVLILDHLDRLVGTPNEQFWLRQIEALFDEPWLRVLVACRPEEFHAVIEFSLPGRFVPARLGERVGPLMHDVDEEGRTTVRSIEPHVRGTDAALDELGRFAIAMRRRRFLVGANVPEGDATFNGSPIVTKHHGRARFVHDALQDFLSARFLARQLQSSTTGFRSLLDLPRDVFRLFLDHLVHSRRIKAAERERASRGFAEAMLIESTLRHWLYDQGRLREAGETVARFYDAFRDHVDVGWVAHMLAALQGYERFIPTDLAERGKSERQRAIAREVVDQLAKMLSKLAARWPNDRERSIHAEVATVYAGDHLLTLVARAETFDAALSGELRGIATSALDVSRTAATGEAFGPWRVAEILGEIERGLSSFEGLKQFDSIVSTRAVGNDYFDLRRYQLAGHIGGTYTLRTSLSSDECKKALRWQDRAITRGLRVVRGMDAVGVTREQYGSRAHGLGDVARHYASRLDLWCQAFVAGMDRDDARYQILQAVQEYNAAYAIAKQSLGPGERLPAAGWYAVGSMALGGVLQWADRRHSTTPNAFAAALKEHAEKAANAHRYVSELHGQYQSGRSPYTLLTRTLGNISTFIFSLFEDR